MPPGARSGDPAARRTGQESQSYEEGLGELLDGLSLLTDGHRKRRDPDRPAAEAAAQCIEHGTVESVEAELVDLVERKRVARHGVVDDSPGTYLGEVAHPAQRAGGR